MSWTVFSRDLERARWLNFDGAQWVADDATTAILSRPGFTVALTPSGPMVDDISGESELYAAALAVIPMPEAVGDLPAYPAVPELPPRSVG